MFSAALISALADPSGRLDVALAPEGPDAAAFVAALAQRSGVGLFIARDEARAQSFASAASFFRPNIHQLRLPAWDSLPYDRISPAAVVAAQRCAALSALARRAPDDKTPLLVIATASAIGQRVPPRARIAGASLVFKVGQVVENDSLERYFAANGFNRASTVRSAGDFAVRGGVADVFAPGAPEPIRFDLFGDTLESIRAFDPETQRTTRQLREASLTPVSEVLLDDDGVRQFRKTFAQMFGAVADPVHEAVSAGVRRQGVEQWLPFFHDRLETVFDYLGPAALIGFDALAMDAIEERFAQAADHYESRRSAPTPKGANPFRAPEPGSLYLSGAQIEAIQAGRPNLRFNPFAAPDGAAAISLGVRSPRSFAVERATPGANVFDAVADHIWAELRAGQKLCVASWSEGAADRLVGVLADHGVRAPAMAADYEAVRTRPADAISICVLPLERGFAVDGLTMLSEQDILGDRLARPRKRRKASNLIAEAAALSPGDLIVHADHGIGRYDGLKTLDVQGAPHDCLDLVYAGGDKLYLPVENIELVSRYGAEDAAAQLDKLGGVAWQTRKARAKQRLRDMAEELIRIAAMRASRTAEVVSAPEGAYDEFCARFPFEETEDQLNAIEDVLGDLSAGRPMDRLICGDVGFGKTEVALRAAFLVAMSGRQVAVVTPTTLLCRQHFRTFEERFRGLPTKVRQLSRMVNAKDANETRRMLSEGDCDIVVGTHALLAKSVSFRDLGLIIVDEEQHFGVKHKERLKELRADTHVMTLSATPIPRTLQLALSGVREMSVIATPPVDRMAVRTYVAGFDPVTVREALLREHYRGGQSFFVAPRIAELPEIEKFLRDTVPEVKAITAHGQMTPSQLDEIMTAFYDGQYDVLVSTTIVESGLDIPRANTLIVFRADMLGLAQLYQLRGRVGRSKLRAYAYLTFDDNKPLTLGAEKRLRILSSLDGLGAGFTLASHDLDMRGGGNLLGEEQSGHIKEVGVELYQSMLEEAVTALKEGAEDIANSRSWSPQINVGVSVLIPEDYVPDLTVRLALYRRLADLASDAEREAFAAELIDRFGKLPPEAEHLIGVASLKALCREMNVAKLDAGPKGAVLTFREGGFGDPAGLVRLVQARPFDYKMRPDGKLVLTGEWPDSGLRLKALRATMESIATVARKAAA